MKSIHYNPAAANRRIPAFSLVELMAAISIMVLLMTAGVPVLSDPITGVRANESSSPLTLAGRSSTN